MSKNFFVLKDEKDYCNGYFILTQNSSIIIYYANENKNRKEFRPEININVEEYINILLSKNLLIMEIKGRVQY